MKSIICVFDTKARAFYAPEIVPNLAVIERYYKQLLPEGSIVRKFPKDFEIYEIGKFSEETGKITAIEPKLICNFSEIFKEADK